MKLSNIRIITELFSKPNYTRNITDNREIEYIKSEFYVYIEGDFYIALLLALRKRWAFSVMIWLDKSMSSF